jgi:hypothetical protein
VASRAERVARAAADDAAPREQQIQHSDHRRAESATRLCQLCEKTRSAYSSCSRSPMSYHWPGTFHV